VRALSAASQKGELGREKNEKYDEHRKRPEKMKSRRTTSTIPDDLPKLVSGRKREKQKYKDKTNLFFSTPKKKSTALRRNTTAQSVTERVRQTSQPILVDLQNNDVSGKRKTMLY